MTQKRRHYFLKLGARNFLFDFFLINKIASHLIIGHGDWKVDSYNDNEDYLSGENGKSVRRVKQQIKDFFEHKKDRENSYFWIFHEERIYALKAVSEIFDLCNYHDPEFKNSCNPIETWEGDKSINKKDSDKFNLWSDAKLCKAKFVEGFEEGLESCDVIHKFASINAHQGYNRRTIAEIKGDEASIADAILDFVTENKSMPQPLLLEEKIKYLSPLQLETLVFLIVYELGLFPAGYRGGNGKSYDILLNKNDHSHKIENLRNVNYISVKLGENQAIEDSKSEAKNNQNKIYIFSDPIKIGESKRNDSCRRLNVKELIDDLVDSQKQKIEKWINCQINLTPFRKS